MTHKTWPISKEQFFTGGIMTEEIGIMDLVLVSIFIVSLLLFVSTIAFS